MPKKGKVQIAPWIRKWRRSTAENTFYEDTANYEYRLAKDAFVKVLVQHRPHLRRERRRELRDEIRKTELRIRQKADRQDDLLQFLLADMGEAYAHEQLLSQRQTAALTKLVELNNTMKHFMEEEFFGNLRALMAEFKSKTEATTKETDEEIHRLNVMGKIMEQEWNEEEMERRTRLLTSVDEVKNRIMEEKQILRLQMEQVITDLYQKMEEEYTKYRNRTEEKLLRYQELRAKDEVSAKEIEFQVGRINTLSRQVAKRKARLLSMQQSAEVKMKYWNELKARLKASIKVVKQQIRKDNLEFEKRFKEMTVNFQNTQDRLQAAQKLGVQVVRHALACHRLQEPEDKIYASAVGQPDRLVQQELRHQELMPINKDMKQLTSMDRFMANTAHIEARKLVNAHENRQLKAQNFRLENLIQEYINAKTVNDHVLSKKDNELLQIRGPTYIAAKR